MAMRDWSCNHRLRASQNAGEMCVIARMIDRVMGSPGWIRLRGIEPLYKL